MTVWICDAWNVRLAYEVEMQRHVRCYTLILSMLKCLLRCNTESKKKKKESCTIPRPSFVNSFPIVLYFNRFLEISLQNSAPLISTIIILCIVVPAYFPTLTPVIGTIIYFLLLFRFIFEDITRLSERLFLIFI